MKTDSFNAEAQRRGGAETSLEETGEVFVEGAGHQFPNRPSKCLTARQWLDGFLCRNAVAGWLEFWRVRAKRKLWENVQSALATRQASSINQKDASYEEECTVRSLAKIYRGRVGILNLCHLAGSVGVAGNTYDGFLHKRRFA